MTKKRVKAKERDKEYHCGRNSRCIDINENKDFENSPSIKEKYYSVPN